MIESSMGDGVREARRRAGVAAAKRVGASASRRGAGYGTPRPIGLALTSQKSPLREATSVRTANRHRWAGARAPRWTGESSLRNSASWPRNFGRRGPLDRVALYG